MSAPKIRAAGGFSTPLQVEAISADTWALLGGLIWTGSDGDSIFVDVGEETDFASVPQILQALIPRTGAWTKAAVIHDMLCRLLNEWHRTGDPMDPIVVPPPVFNAVDTDAVFEKIMLEEGVPRWKASLMWAAVRVGAALNPARREGWWSTFPRFARVAGATVLVAVAALLGIHELVELVVPW